jgi:hypothetical protein
MLLACCRALAAVSSAACNAKREALTATAGGAKRASEGATFQVTIAHKYLEQQEMQATLEPAGMV